MDDHLWLQIAILLILILCNAFFAAAEISILSLSEGKLKRQIEDGDKKAVRLLALVREPGQFLSAIQIGITLAGFLASAFAADAFAGRMVRFLVEEQGVTVIPASTLHTMMVVLVTIVLSYFTLVLGELVPKRVALQRAEGVARVTGGVVYVIAVVFRPVIWFLSKSTNGVLRLLRVDPAAAEEQVSEDEIRMMVDMGEEKGTIETSERDLIENIFEFNNTTAEDVMIHRTDMVTIWVEDTHQEVVDTIRQSGLSRYPVYDEDVDDIVGILNNRDYLLNAQLEHPKPLKQLLRTPYFVPESVRTDRLFRDLQSKKTHMAIVVDEYGGTSGLVTLEDLLEEIVGNIYDEFDPQDKAEIIPQGENLWRVAGSAELEQLSELLDVELPLQEEYDTLNGLVFAQLSVIPDDGSQITVEVDGLRIQVQEITDRRVEWALVSVLPHE